MPASEIEIKDVAIAAAGYLSYTKLEAQCWFRPMTIIQSNAIEYDVSQGHVST